jgi:hypothetical protein
MGSKKSFYEVFFNDQEFSLGFSELVSANTRFLNYCDENRPFPEGTFSEIKELNHSLCLLNIYYSDEQDETDLGPQMMEDLLCSQAIPSLFKVRHLMVAEYIVEGSISSEHWRERSDVAALIPARTNPPIADRTGLLMRSTLFDAPELKQLEREFSGSGSMIETFRSFLPGQSSKGYSRR